MKNIGIPYLCIYKPKRQVIPILEILDKDTIINEIIPHLPIEKRVLMEVIHLLFVEENKQQSNAWCDSYRSILNHFDTAISSWKGFNYLSFIIIELKKFNTKSQDELYSQIEIIQKIDLKKDNIPLLTLHSSLFTFDFSLFTFHSSLFILHSSFFILHSSLFTLHFSLFTLPPVNNLKHGYLHERASPRY